eukprot:TRINITY_DN12391_c3_g8_i1.p1 TRINITY_DN12391_c3_g8~~TRINITY_DN12391_c3_g8_i1.p1  ORF type:complete len:153 (+),score=27.15 TRINITY_DN12391_c3_g8_i1:264-722(+)
MSWLFPCLTVEEEQPRRRLDKSMIGDPADFRHTGHIGSGDTSQALSTVKTQMASKGGDQEADIQAAASTSAAVAGAIDLADAQAKFGKGASTEALEKPASAPATQEVAAESAEPASPAINPPDLSTLPPPMDDVADDEPARDAPPPPPTQDS